MDVAQNQAPAAIAPIRLSRDELAALAVRALTAQGMPEPDAIDAAEILVLADLFGVSTHGVDRIPVYSERLRIGGIKALPGIAVERSAPSLLRIDGDNGIGPLVGRRALRATMELARETGLAAAFVRGSNHFGPIISYAHIAAAAGFATIIATNATTTIAPSGGKEAKLGNNPLGLGVPNPGGDPVILDMAMSVVARAKVRLAADKGEAIPPSWATDREGRPTTDPNAALHGFLQPIGGYKGYGLALMVDLFAGLLSGAAYLNHVSSWADAPEAPQNLGHIFILFDTNRLGRPDWLGPLVEDFTAILHATPPADPARPVLVPGETEYRAFHQRSRHGVELPAALHAKLTALAGKRN